MDLLEGMRILIQVVQAGSMSAAGRSLGMSPASISRKISMLEDVVGAKLLSRTSRKLTLTTIGSFYCEKATTIVEQVDHLKTSISEQQSVPSGLLVVHTGSSIANRFLSSALPAFLLRYPDITLKLSLTEDHPDFTEGGVDISIGIGVPEDPDLMIRKLSQGVERVVYASPSYLTNHPEIHSPQDLLEHNCLSFKQANSDDEHALWYYRTPSGIKELRVKGNLLVNNTDILHSAVVTGIGIGLLPAWIVAEDLSFGRVQRILPQYEMSQSVIDHGLYAVFTKANLLMPKVRVFIDFLVDVFRKSEPEVVRMAMDAKRQSIDTARRSPDALRWIHPKQ